MVKIRLKRLGKRNAPFYRIVAISEGKKVGGQDLEILGTWMPSNNTKEVNKKGIEAWVKKGAQVSAAVKKLLA